MFRVILFGTDFSEHSLAACQLACALARDHSSRLVLVHVGPAATNLPHAALVTPPTEAV